MIFTLLGPEGASLRLCGDVGTWGGVRKLSKKVVPFFDNFQVPPWFQN
jgi:hypothetical protein